MESYMVGIPHKNIDTSTWGAKEWRFTQLWNSGFLVLWTAFYSFAAADGFRTDVPLFFMAPLLLLGGFGFVWQAAGLVRLTMWLHKYKPDKPEYLEN